MVHFESHSIYSINLFGVRNGSRGVSLQTEVQTGGYGLPPIPLRFRTEQRELENKTVVILTIREVSVPYIDFSISISCKQNNSTRQIKLFENISEFKGGNLSLTLNITQKLNSLYNCSAVLSNVFGSNSFIFTYTGAKSTTTTTTTIIPETETTDSLASQPITPFLTALIVVMSLLLLISICITVVIVLIVYLCVRSSMYEITHSGISNKDKGRIGFTEPGEGFEDETIRVIKKLSNPEVIGVDNTCETTSV